MPWPAPAPETAQTKPVHDGDMNPVCTLLSPWGKKEPLLPLPPSPPCYLPGPAPQSYFSMLSVPGVKLGSTSPLQLRAGSPLGLAGGGYHQDVRVWRQESGWRDWNESQKYPSFIRKEKLYNLQLGMNVIICHANGFCQLKVAFINRDCCIWHYLVTFV